MIRRALGRSLGAVLAAALGVAALAALAPGSSAVSSCAAAGPDHAALVVEHGDGSLVTRCVSFDGASISGVDLLNDSGVEWQGQGSGGLGVAVCQIDNEPAHFTDCLAKDYYWALFVSRSGGAWQLSGVGVSGLTLADGDAEGWRWVPEPAAPPAPAGVCPAAPAATPTPAPTPTSAPTPTPKPAPAKTPKPTPSIAAATPTHTPTNGIALASPTESETTAAQTPTEAPTSTAAPSQSTEPSPTASPAASPVTPGASSTQSGGIDPGLIVAAIVFVALVGLATLRLRANRRRSAG